MITIIREREREREYVMMDPSAISEDLTRLGSGMEEDVAKDSVREASPRAWLGFEGGGVHLVYEGRGNSMPRDPA